MAKKLLTTAAGLAVYPHLLVPDTKFKPEGEYKVKLKLADQAAQTFKGEIDAAMKTALADGLKAHAEKQKESKGKKLKTPKLIDPPYTENEDGSIDFSFKMLASGVSRKDNKPWSRKPALFDKFGKPITENIKIGGGSKIKVSYTMEGFCTPIGAGVSLRLYGVQIIDLVEFGGDASYHGFGNEGEEGEEEVPAATAATEPDAKPAEDDDEF